MKTLILPFILFLVSCDNYPKDASDTLKHIRNNQLKVGIARANNGSGVQPAGQLVDIVKAYSNRLKATLRWVPGSESELVELLKDHEIDIAIGGFFKSSLYKEEVAFTKPCYIEKIKIGASSQSSIPGNIEGKEVQVTNPWTAMYVKEKNGKPVMTDSLRGHVELMAGSEDELKSKNLELSNYTLHKSEYVIAIPKGENAFLMDLEKFIDSYGGR